jgi:hypothetical protein
MNTNKAKIHTVDSLKAMTVECGDCWEWQKYIANGTPYVCHDGKMTSVRKLFTSLMGGYLPAKWFISTKCDNQKCVNPDHYMKLSRSAMSSRNGKKAVQSVGKRIKIQKLKQASYGKLSWEKVDEIRASDEPSRELAKKYSVDKSLICRVRANKAWRRFENNVFAGLM